MALVALEGRFARVNRVLCEIVGYSPAELTSLTFQAITHPDDLDIDVALAGHLARGEIPRYQLEKRYIRKDGTIVDTMLNAAILRGRDGAPLYYITQIENITERKRLEQDLRLSAAKSSGILSISADAIVSIDESQRITLFNEGACHDAFATDIEFRNGCVSRKFLAVFGAVRRPTFLDFGLRGDAEKHRGFGCS